MALKRDTTGWRDHDWYDLLPEAGSFVSYKWEDYEINGWKVRAANWLHAEYLWVRHVVEQQGEEWGRCCLCNQQIRYAVLFTDADGKYHMTGQDCAGFVVSGLKDRAEWSLKRKFSDIKEVATRHGVRFALADEVPPWYWNVPKAERPEYCSIFKGKCLGRDARPKWFLSVWGETRGDVIRNYEELQKIKGRYQ